jgi:hypothetical protein
MEIYKSLPSKVTLIIAIVLNGYLTQSFGQTNHEVKLTSSYIYFKIIENHYNPNSRTDSSYMTPNFINRIDSFLTFKEIESNFGESVKSLILDIKCFKIVINENMIHERLFWEINEVLLYNSIYLLKARTGYDESSSLLVKEIPMSFSIFYNFLLKKSNLMGLDRKLLQSGKFFRDVKFKDVKFYDFYRRYRLERKRFLFYDHFDSVIRR